MLRYLTGESNVAGHANENYARELMELFTLGPVNDAGAPNYSESDVQQLAKALTGWQINDADPNAASSFFTTARWYSGPKVAFGKYGNWKTPDVVALVLSQPNHPTFLVRKLWGEFIPTPSRQPTLRTSRRPTRRAGMQIKPLLAEDPDPSRAVRLDRRAEHAEDAGRLRRRRAARARTPDHRLDGRRLPRRDGPDAVLPAERLGLGGRAPWLNTNTALARWGFVTQIVTSGPKIDDVVGETTQAALRPRLRRVSTRPGSPRAPATRSWQPRTRMPSKQPTQRLQRQQVLRTLMLAGPDAQVM